MPAPFPAGAPWEQGRTSCSRRYSCSQALASSAPFTSGTNSGGKPARAAGLASRSTAMQAAAESKRRRLLCLSILQVYSFSWLQACSIFDGQEGARSGWHAEAAPTNNRGTATSATLAQGQHACLLGWLRKQAWGCQGSAERCELRSAGEHVFDAAWEPNASRRHQQLPQHDTMHTVTEHGGRGLLLPPPPTPAWRTCASWSPPRKPDCAFPVSLCLQPHLSDSMQELLVLHAW